MGNCVCTKPTTTEFYRGRVRKPGPWALNEPITRADLNALREKFWARPQRHGRRESWVALQVASEILLATTENESYAAQAMLDKAGLEREFQDMRVCYDRRGVRYELPLYVISEPTNIIEN